MISQEEAVQAVANLTREFEAWKEAHKKKPSPELNHLEAIVQSHKFLIRELLKACA